MLARIAKVVLTLLFLSHLAQSSFAAGRPIQIHSLRLIPFDGQKTVVMVSASEPPQFDIFSLRNPERLVIDFRNSVEKNALSATASYNNPAVVRIRTSQFDDDLVRIVLDLRQPVSYRTSVEGNTLIIQVLTAGSAPSSSRADVEANLVNTPKPVTTPTSEETKNNSANRSKNKSRVKMKGYTTDRYERGSKRATIPSLANAYALSFRFRQGSESSYMKMDYAMWGYDVMDSGMQNYVTQDFKLGYHWRFGPDWHLKTVGKVGMNPTADKYQFAPELEYRFGQGSSVNVYGGHATKIYPWEDRTDQSRFFGIEYERKFGKQTLEFGYRYTGNASDLHYYDYVNSKYFVGYRIPWSSRARTLFRVEYSPKQYDSRFVTGDFSIDPDLRSLLQTEGWSFTTLTRIRLSRTFELVPRYSLQIMNSNDPWKEDFARHYPSFALRGRW